MGNSFSSEEFVIEHCKEYLPLERAGVTSTGTHVFAKFLEENSNGEAQSLVKIEANSNQIIGRVSLADSVIQEIRVSPNEQLVAYRTKSEIVLLEAENGAELLRVAIDGCFFGFSNQHLFFQKSPNTFNCLDLKSRQLTDYFKSTNHIQAIYHLSVDSAARFAFFVVQHHLTPDHFIAKFNLVEGKFSHVYRSSCKVRRLVYSESRELLLAAKDSGTVTVYSVRGRIISNLKNFKVGENVQHIKISVCGKFLLGCVLTFGSLKFYIWNLDQLVLVATYTTRKDSGLFASDLEARSPSYLSLVYFNTRQIVVQLQSQLCFFSLVAPSEEPKFIFDFGLLPLPNTLLSKRQKLLDNSFKSSSEFSRKQLLGVKKVPPSEFFKSPKSRANENGSLSPQDQLYKNNKMPSTSDEENEKGDKKSREDSPKSSQTLNRWKQGAPGKKSADGDIEEAQINSDFKSLNLTKNELKSHHSKFHRKEYESVEQSEEDIEDFSENESPWRFKREGSKLSDALHIREKTIMRFFPESNLNK